MDSALGPEPTDTPAKGERRGIQSIEVGGTLLQALVLQGQALGLKDLARAAGMPPAKAHAYLVSLGKLGLIEQDSVTGRYGLGPFALQMGLAALHTLNPVRAALPEVARLVDEVELNVALSVWGNHGPTVIHIEECRRPIHVNMRPGTVMTPLLRSATGRVFAAFLPERLIAPLLAQEMAQDGAQAPDAAQALLHEVRQQRLARALGDLLPGIHAFAAPVFDSGGHLALTVTALGPAGTLDTTWDGPTAQRVRDCAARISQRLGCSETARSGGHSDGCSPGNSLFSPGP